MAEKYKDPCAACKDLKVYAHDFLVHGVTDDVANGFYNNTGFIKNDKRKNCEDLQNANDCLIFGENEKASMYNQCDWQEAYATITNNAGIMYELLIHSDCGQWDQIEALWKALNGGLDALWKEIEKLNQRCDTLTTTINNLRSYVDGQDNKISAKVSNIEDALMKILVNLQESGAWQPDGTTMNGNFVAGRHIAAGNINVFGGTPDGNSFIRTSNNATENDLAGGV